MTTTNEKQIIGKVISLVNNEDPNYTMKLLFITNCEKKMNNKLLKWNYNGDFERKSFNNRQLLF